MFYYILQLFEIESKTGKERSKRFIETPQCPTPYAVGVTYTFTSDTLPGPSNVDANETTHSEPMPVLLDTAILTAHKIPCN